MVKLANPTMLILHWEASSNSIIIIPVDNEDIGSGNGEEKSETDQKSQVITLECMTSQ